jgi:hypothetical protein
MKFYIEYTHYPDNVNRRHGWDIIEFAFRSEITRESILKKIGERSGIYTD